MSGPRARLLWLLALMMSADLNPIHVREPLQKGDSCPPRIADKARDPAMRRTREGNQ